MMSTSDPAPVIPAPARRQTEGTLPDFTAIYPAPAYTPGDSVATREAFGAALVTLGSLDRRVVALDADVKNSTFSEKFEKAYPDRFYQTFIAEQVMVGAAMGLASRGAVPFPSTFACFLGRAADFIRMAGISNLNIKLAGSHVGVSIGEDGPSQMALEDLAMMRAVPNCTVLYPCDAMSAERLVALAAATPGPVYLRLSRPKTPVIYDASESFVVGGSKLLKQGADERRDRRRRRRHRLRSAQGARDAGARRHRDHASSTRTRCSRSIERQSWRQARPRAAASSPSKITTRPAVSATP